MSENGAAAGYSVPALAFLGDSVYEQLVREMLVRRANMPAQALNREKVKYVCCEYQSAAVERIYETLTEREQEIYRRGRNRDSSAHPKHSKAMEYRRATGLECVFGYLKL